SIAIGELHPRETGEALHLDLGRPVRVLALEPFDDARELFDVRFRGGRVPGARRAERPRVMRLRLRVWELAFLRLELRRFLPRAALERDARRDRRERIRP